MLIDLRLDPKGPSSRSTQDASLAAGSGHKWSARRLSRREGERSERSGNQKRAGHPGATYPVWGITVQGLPGSLGALTAFHPRATLRALPAPARGAILLAGATRPSAGPLLHQTRDDAAPRPCDEVARSPNTRPHHCPVRPAASCFVSSLWFPSWAYATRIGARSVLQAGSRSETRRSQRSGNPGEAAGGSCLRDFTRRAPGRDQGDRVGAGEAGEDVSA